MKMKLSFRHYSEKDPIPLRYISQIPGMKHIVSAVYSCPVGEIWQMSDIERIASSCESVGLRFSVVESIPVHEDIKLYRGDCEKYTKNFCENIRRVSSVGVDCVTYNFMPIFDWTRTQLDKELPDGSKSLVMYFDQLKSLDPSRDSLSLPGWNESYTKEQIRELMEAYRALGEERLWDNLSRFLEKILPVAEECNVKMAIHPDDPPYPVFSVPRIISREENIDRLFSLYESPSNCLCFCTGSIGCANTNDTVAMCRKYAEINKIAFVHMRNVKNHPDGSFEEVGHLSSCGSVDMLEIAKVLAACNYDGYVRPDHGRMIWGEENSRPGYGLYDRALGATYINGLFEACENFFGGQKFENNTHLYRR